MPTYRVTDPSTGKSLKLTGDSPPTDEELEQLFAEAGSAPAGPKVPTEAPALGEPGDGRQPSGALDTAVGTALTGGLGLMFPETAQKLGRGAVDAAGRLDLGARELMGNVPPEEAAQLRPQLAPQGAAETLGSLAPGAALAGAAPAGILMNAAVGGGLSALNSGQAEDALSGAAISGIGSGIAGLAGKGVQAVLGKSADRNLDRLTMPAAQKLAEIRRMKESAKDFGAMGGAAIGMAKAGPLGAIAGMEPGARLAARATGPIARLMNSDAFNTLSMNAKLKVINVLKSGNMDDIARTVWRLLPSSTESETSQGITASPTEADLLAEAKRRRDAQAVISR